MKIPRLTMNAAVAVLFLVASQFATAKPPREPKVENVDVNKMAPGDPQAQAALATATKNMSAGVWTVNGTVTLKKTIKLHGLLSGADFDLTMEPGVKPETPMRGMVIKDKGWVCSDGETWHAGSADDRLLYNWAHVPIMENENMPPFEKIGVEPRNGTSCLHIRLKVPKKNPSPKEVPHYWLVLDSGGQAQYIGHVEMPLYSQVAKSVIYCSLDYAPTKENIAPPSLGAPVDDQPHDFNDIDKHKMEWAKKIVRVDLDPKLLQSEQIGESTYRGFVKDSAGHYGRVEFPHDSLVKLGFLKKTVSGIHAWEELQKMDAAGRTEGAPITLYVEIIPLGERPAARAVAVGSKVNHEADGTITYSW
jgi:hypothetical protein